MDAKKAYRGAKAALRTAERINAELKERNYALAYGARPSPKEAQAAQEYVEGLERSLNAAENEVACLREALSSERHYSQGLFYDLWDAEDRTYELEREIISYRERLRWAKAIGLGACVGFLGHLLYWHWDEFPAIW